MWCDEPKTFTQYCISTERKVEKKLLHLYTIRNVTHTVSSVTKAHLLKTVQYVCWVCVMGEVEVDICRCPFFRPARLDKLWKVYVSYQHQRYFIFPKFFFFKYEYYLFYKVYEEITNIFCVRQFGSNIHKASGEVLDREIKKISLNFKYNSDN